MIFTRACKRYYTEGYITRVGIFKKISDWRYNMSEQFIKKGFWDLAINIHKSMPNLEFLTKIKCK